MRIPLKRMIAEKLMPVLERLRFCMWAVWVWSRSYSSVVASNLYGVSGRVVSIWFRIIFSCSILRV